MDKRGEGSRKQLTHPSARGGESGATAGGEGLRITGCSLTAYFVAINSPSSQACRLSTSMSQQGTPARPSARPGVGGRMSGGPARPPGARTTLHGFGGAAAGEGAGQPRPPRSPWRKHRVPGHRESPAAQRGGGVGGREEEAQAGGAPRNTRYPLRQRPLQGGPPGSPRPHPPGSTGGCSAQARGGLPALGAVPGPPDARRARGQAGGEQRPERRGAGLLRRSTGRKDARAAPLRKGHLWKRNGG